nr:hypothetical protein [Haliangium ochraceum]
MLERVELAADPREVLGRHVEFGAYCGHVSGEQVALVSDGSSQRRPSQPRSVL